MIAFWEPKEIAPCRSACPVGIDVPRYVRLIADGKFDDAIAVIREKNPFPSVCGRVCFHPCESKCNLNYLDNPIAICALKRSAAEHADVTVPTPTPAGATGKAVAVVGSGPAGLTAAYYLSRIGHKVTVFEAQAEAGGMMRYGIPDYRLPKEVLGAEILAIRQAGVDLRTNVKIDSPSALKEQGYDAVFVAIGANKASGLGIEGENLPVVRVGLNLMKELNMGCSVNLGNKVIVIGGGNTAIDAARSALRLGSKEVSVFYRRSRGEMPASPIEVEQALMEGINIQFLTALSEIRTVNGKAKVECIRTQLSELDDSGRRKPIPLPGSEFSVVADTIISAVGQVCELSSGFRSIIAGGLIQADSNTMATSQVGIFAGGDAVSGAKTVIDAIAAGRKAAVSIDRYLGGDGDIDETLTPVETNPMRTHLQGFPVGKRTKMPITPVDERLNSFSVVELGFSRDEALNEANRCLRCDLPITIEAEKCMGCLFCVMRCSLKYDNTFSPSESKIEVVPMTDKVNKIAFREECDSCGICARYCPHDALYRGQRPSAEPKAKDA